MNVGLTEDPLLVVETSERLVNGLKCVFVNDGAPKKVTKLHKCCEGPDHLAGHMTGNHRKQDLPVFE